jgi:hypothetical protein
MLHFWLKYTDAIQNSQAILSAAILSAEWQFQEGFRGDKHREGKGIFRIISIFHQTMSSLISVVLNM